MNLVERKAQPTKHGVASLPLPRSKRERVEVLVSDVALVGVLFGLRQVRHTKSWLFGARFTVQCAMVC